MEFILIKISPLELATAPVGGFPVVRVRDNLDDTSSPSNHKYVEKETFPAIPASFGTEWTRNLTLTEYGWAETTIAAPVFTPNIIENSESTGDPSLTEYPDDGQNGVHYNSTSGKLYQCHNYLGTIYKIELL